ncbi:protein CYCLOPS-like isoform X2 [Salvia splendens]|uniref:protein CYCLOPS-like isoform X2 n=1 Tax=Salvia splendens TaxID=180675 RepID=UPI001C2734F3|nr:protein CYCLOPS-like isoform X2 [Salvia splendens]
MEMEGRGYSEFYRNTSEELLIKMMMESPVGIPAPTMEMLGFKNLTQSFRTDSEELFKSWLTNGENSSCHSAGLGHHPRQASRRISTELAGLSNQNSAAVQKKMNEDTFQQTSYAAAADSSTDLESARSGVEKGVQASNLFLTKAWFNSSQPMTRSRSSELRRKYVAMQNSQTPIGLEAMIQQQENTHFNFYNNMSTIYENATHFNTSSSFMSPSISSFSTFNNPQMGHEDKISSVVSMLKGTLESKKVEREAVEGTYYDSGAAQVLSHGCFNQELFENQGTFGDVSLLGDDETRVLQTIEESLMEGIMGPLNQTSTLSREPSQSESCVAAPMASGGVDVYDDLCISAQAPSVCESSRHIMGTRRSPEDSSRSRDVRERVYDSSRDDQKQEGLVRYGSIKSSGSVDRGDPTKKRRVERSRKMAEAKEKSSTLPVASDMQSVLKRCENLEKEVRSLKLNLAFMNRKDSEQTKQIEELLKQNQDLGGEKERLLEEIERIVSQTGKIKLITRLRTLHQMKSVLWNSTYRTKWLPQLIKYGLCVQKGED